MTRRIATLIMLMAGMWTSCIKDQYDFSQVPDINLGPFITPVAKVNFSLADFLEDADSLVQLQADSSLHLVYSLDTFGRLTTRDLFEFAPSYSTNVNVDLPFVLFRPDSVTSTISLGQMISQFDALTQAQFAGLNGTSSPFPAIPVQNAGTAAIPSFTNFASVTSLPSFYNLKVTNTLPVSIQTLVISVYSQGNLVTTFPFTAIGAGATTQLAMPSAGGVVDGQNFSYEIDQFGLLGSSTNVPVDFNDGIQLELKTFDLKGTAGTGIVDLSLLPTLNASYDFSFDNGEEAKEIRFSSGSIAAQFGTPLPLTATLKLTNFTEDSGQPFSMTISGAGGSQSGSLNGVTADLDANTAVSSNRIDLELDFSSSPQNPVTFGPNDLNFALTLDLQNLDYEHAIGYFSQRILDVDTSNASFELTPFQDFSGLVQFNDPVARVLVYNEFGIPMRLNLDMQGSNAASSQQEDLIYTTDIAYPGLIDMGSGVNGAIELNAQNSNLPAFLSILPNVIAGNGSIEFNTLGNTPPYENHLIQDGILQLGLELELGLNFNIQDMVFSDTLDISGLNLGLGDSTKLEKWVLYINTENGFSLDGDVIFELADSTGAVFASESGALMAAATIATSGRVIEPGFTELEITFDDMSLARIDEKTEMRIRVEFESPDSGNSPFIVHYSNFLNLYIATQVQLSTTL